MANDAPELRTKTIPVNPSPRMTSNSTPPPVRRLIVWATELIFVSAAVSNWTIQSYVFEPLGAPLPADSEAAAVEVEAAIVSSAVHVAAPACPAPLATVANHRELTVTDIR